MQGCYAASPVVAAAHNQTGDLLRDVVIATHPMERRPGFADRIGQFVEHCEHLCCNHSDMRLARRNMFTLNMFRVNMSVVDDETDQPHDHIPPRALFEKGSARFSVRSAPAFPG